MQHALTLAKQGLGKTYPNPAVGCVIVKQGKVAWYPPTTSTSISVANNNIFKSHHSACFGSDRRETNIIAGHKSVLTPIMALYTASRLNKQLGMCLYQCSNLICKQVIGEGYHPKAGEPHAEVFALRAAGMHLL